MITDIGSALLRDDIRIVESSDGGPIRRIINGRHVKPTGRYPAVKADGISLPYEADHEEALFEISDADAAVTTIMCQPHRMEIPVPWQKRPLIYIPDCRRTLADSTIEIVETKKDDDPRMRDPDYLLKLNVAQEVYRLMGWSFRIITRREIIGTRLHKNAHDIVAWAYAKVPRPVQFGLSAAIAAAGGSLPYVKACEVAGGVPALSALVVRGCVHIDLRLPIDDDSPVTLVDRDRLRRNSPPLL